MSVNIGGTTQLNKRGKIMAGSTIIVLIIAALAVFSLSVLLYQMIFGSSSKSDITAIAAGVIIAFSIIILYAESKSTSTTNSAKEQQNSYDNSVAAPAITIITSPDGLECAQSYIYARGVGLSCNWDLFNNTRLSKEAYIGNQHPLEQ